METLVNIVSWFVIIYSIVNFGWFSILAIFGYVILLGLISHAKDCVIDPKIN